MDLRVSTATITSTHTASTTLNISTPHRQQLRSHPFEFIISKPHRQQLRSRPFEFDNFKPHRQQLRSHPFDFNDVALPLPETIVSF